MWVYDGSTAGQTQRRQSSQIDNVDTIDAMVTEVCLVDSSDHGWGVSSSASVDPRIFIAIHNLHERA